MAGGYPSIHPGTGWMKIDQGNNRDHRFFKDIAGNGNGINIGLNNLSYQISAVDSAADPNTAEAKHVTFQLTVEDNTKPIISQFTLSGLPTVDGFPRITLQESTKDTKVTPTMSLVTSDNGAISSAIVEVRDPVNNI